MFNIKSFLLVIGIFSFSNICYSQMMEEEILKPEPREEGQSEYFMGLSGGVNSPVESSIPSSPEAAVSLAYQPGGALGLGLEVSTAELKDAEKNQRVTALIQSAYKVGGDTPVVRGSFLGVGIGPSYVNSKVEVAVAPVIGVDIPLSKRAYNMLSLGVNAKYIGITNSPDSYVGNAALKYWY